MVRKLKAKQRGPSCSYCDDKAVWRGYGHSMFSCDTHKACLVDWDLRERAEDYSDARFYAGY